MSLLVEMRGLLDEDTELTESQAVLEGLFNFCESTGIELEAGEDLEDLISEVDGWIENSDLTEDELARLSEFADKLKKIARGVAKGIGKAVGTYHRAKDAIGAAKAKAKAAVGNAKKGIKSFSHSLGAAYKSGETQGHHPQAKPAHAPAHPAAKKAAAPAPRPAAPKPARPAAPKPNKPKMKSGKGKVGKKPAMVPPTKHPPAHRMKIKTKITGKAVRPDGTAWGSHRP